MKSSRGPRLALAAALLPTLGLKLLWTGEALEPDPALFVAQSETALRTQGFATQRVTRPFGTVVIGQRGNCRLMVGDYPPNGTLAEPLLAESRSVGPLSYVWAGAASERAPKLVPLVEYYLKRELGRLGFRPARRPILAVATGAGCGGVQVDWTTLETLPR